MAYQMNTRTGRSFWEVTSVMQNAIRKGDFEIAGHCMWELLPQYTPYLRKRFLVISAEDCFGVITKEIVALSKIGTEEALTKALSLLCLSKKNRDADYFVCNLMTFDNLVGGDNHDLQRALYSAIRKTDVISAGQLCMELFKKSRRALWDSLVEMSRVYYPHLEDEILALNFANEQMTTKPNEETIYVAKAIVLMWTCRNPKEDLLAVPGIGMDFYRPLDFDKIPSIKAVDHCAKVEGNFPEWAYNWHTYYGKYTLRRDAVHAIENDQRLLNPLEENLFDDCTWNRDINACLLKHNPRQRPLPYDDGKRNPEEKYGKKE